MSFSWPGLSPCVVSDDLLRCVSVCSDGVIAGDFEMGGDLSSAFNADETLLWPHNLLRAWETPLVVFPCLRFALKSALLARLAKLCTLDDELKLIPFCVTQQSFLTALAKNWTDPMEVLYDADPSAALLRAQTVPGEWDGVALLVDAWVGDLTPLHQFLCRHTVHTAVRSERYGTEAKAGIGADESSSDPPLPRFLGQAVNDTFRVGSNKIPLSFLALACDPHVFHAHQLGRYFLPLIVQRASPTDCAMLVKSMGSDAPSAKLASDIWVAFLCGAAASVPPPVDSNPATMRRLLTSLTGALHHLCSGRLNIGRQVRNCGFKKKKKKNPHDVKRYCLRLDFLPLVRLLR
jgi:hypothetical protein